MAAVLVSHNSCCRIQGSQWGIDLSVTGSVKYDSHKKLKKHMNDPVKARKRFYRFKVDMQQRKLPDRVVKNGRIIEMVPTSEVKNLMSKSTSASENSNGSAKNVNGFVKEVNGVAGPVDKGGSLVKKDTSLALSKFSGSDDFPPFEGQNNLPSAEGFSWANENYNFIQRNIDVWSFIISLRLRVLLDNAKWTYIGGFTEDKQVKRRRKTASWVQESILQLGPTFIKLGQLLSTRSDVFPKEYVEELGKLQDRVPAFSANQAKKLIEAELNSPMHVLFKKFEDQPIAAASLGSSGHFA